jgi:polygalacturonase
MRAIVTDFGAVPDGKTLNTDAIQRTIDACAEAGGGTVVFPPGRFLSGTLELRSYVSLFLEAGATLVGSPRMADYRESGFVHVDNHFSQGEGGHSLSLIYADGAEDVGIRGPGSIDLSSDAFFDFTAIKPIIGVDEADLTPAQRAEASVPKITGPTQPIFFTACTRVEITGVKILDAPSLTINLNACADVRIHHITIRDDPRVPISDGIHICASTDVIISDSVFTCGDDCVAITGVTNWDGVSERIVITNCTMQSSSAAVRVGYLAGKIRDVVISNLAIHNTNRGFTIFAGDDGWVENVSIQNIVMHTRIYAGDWWGKGEPLVIFAPKSYGRIENIRVRGVTARTENGVVIVGDRKNVREILLEDWWLELSHGANYELFGGVIDLQPVEMLPLPKGKAPWLYISDAGGVRLSNIRYRAPEAGGVKVPAEAVYHDVDIAMERDVVEMT